MKNDDIQGLGGAAWRIALLAAEELEQLLAGPSDEKTDTKSARELSGIMKDMSVLAKELRLTEKQAMSVVFSEEADSAAK